MRFFKAFKRDENGQILLLVLIILAFASIGLVPLMGFISTGLAATRSDGSHTQEIYAAEAGIRDAIWKIQRVVPGMPKKDSDQPLQYTLASAVNGRSVNVTISWINGAYRVSSTATDNYTSHQSTIDSDLSIGGGGGVDLSGFTNYALTSPGTITTKSSDVINGNIWVDSASDYQGSADLTGNVTVAPVTGWPTIAQLQSYFAGQVDTSSPYSNGTINVAQACQGGPLYAQGYSNGNYVLTGTGQLSGAIYVVGNLDLDNNAHIDLNGQSIFVTGSVTTSPQAWVGGPGAIIAGGNVVFSPGVNSSFIFIMSITGQVNFQPNGDFVGAVAGDATVGLQPHCTLTWQSPGVGDLGLPGLFNSVTGINTWNIH